MAGLSKAISGDMVQVTLGTIARDVHMHLKRSQEAVEFLAANDDQQLLADYGISGPDAQDLRAAYADLDQLWGIYRGQQTLTAAKNFRQTIRRIFGLGFV